MSIIKGTCRGWIKVQTETLLRVRYTSIKRWFLPHTVYFLYPVPSCDNLWLHNDIWASLVLLAQCRTPISLSNLRVCSAVNWPEGIFSRSWHWSWIMWLVYKHFCMFPCVRTFLSESRTQICITACLCYWEQDLGQKWHSKNELA